METKQTKRGAIEKIWGEDFWRVEAIKIEMAYWGVLKKKIPNTAAPKEINPTEHRIEAFVRDLAHTMGLGNLHVGLTSSDLEDNIRAIRLEASCAIISKMNSDLYAALSHLMFTNKGNLIAYTHLIPAGVTTLEKRFSPQLEAANSYGLPAITYKGIGGALGDRMIQDTLKMDRGEVDQIFAGKKIQQYTSQTVSHLNEFHVASWLSFHASILAKMANDFRQMFAFEQAWHSHDDIGSTAIAGKRPNPWRYERISAMAEVLYPLPGEISRIAANCLLERTLTNQSVLNYSFKQAFLVFVGMIEDFKDAIAVTKIANQTEECKKPKYHTEQQMVALILKGTPREIANKRISKKYER